MEINQIRDIFEFNSEQAYMDRDGQIPVAGLYHTDIVDVIVTMKSGCKITIYCGEDTTIDCTNSHPNAEIGIDDTLIEPIKDIEAIEINWR